MEVITLIFRVIKGLLRKITFLKPVSYSSAYKRKVKKFLPVLFFFRKKAAKNGYGKNGMRRRREERV